jgi:asparagine synthase (glutamine-hydrolysing)
LAYRYVPREILDRPKQGFGVPIGEWLRAPLKGWAEERLQESSLFQKIPLQQQEILRLWKIHLSRSRDVHPLLWALLMLIGFYENQVEGGI